MYVLTDDSGRVRVCYDGCAPLSAVEVAEPDGFNWEHIGDWVLDGGALVYEPQPAVEHVEPPDETALLRAQVQALTERGEFLEDCIAEMAMVVYGGV